MRFEISLKTVNINEGTSLITNKSNIVSSKLLSIYQLYISSYFINKISLLSHFLTIQLINNYCVLSFGNSNCDSDYNDIIANKIKLILEYWDLYIRGRKDGLNINENRLRSNEIKKSIQKTY